MNVENGPRFALEETFELAVEAAAVGVWELSLSSYDVNWSPRCNQIFGLPLETKLTYKEFLQSVHFEDRPMVDRVVQAALDPRGTGNYDIEYRVVRPNSEIRWVAAKGRVLFGSGTGALRPHRFLGTVIDITDQRHAEHARSHLAAIVESSHDAILSNDLNGVVRSWNAGAERMFGYSKQEMIGCPVLVLIQPDFHIEEAKTSGGLRSGEKADHCETIGTRKNGEQFEVSLTISPVKDGSGKIIGASRIIRDISQQKRAERRLHQASKMEAVGQLTGGIAHDFNNILAIMLGNLELVASSLPLDSAEHQRIRQAITAAELGANLTGRLLAFARQQPLDSLVIDTAAVVSKAAEFIGGSIGSKVLLQITIVPTLWQTKVDKTQLETALLNLSVNARDAMPSGGQLHIDCRNVVLEEPHSDGLEMTTPKEYVLISVRDTGTGMTADELARASEPFFTTKPVGQGTGLGLSMVSGFIKQCGGEFRIESQLLKGTTIHLYLPRGTVCDTEHKSDTPSLPSCVQKADETILLVEDEAGIREVFSYGLRSLGYHVIDVEDGPSALAVLHSEQRVDLLLTDINLPGGMNGVALAEMAAALHPAIKIIYSSACTTDVLRRDYKPGEGWQLITKPTPLGVLFTTIRDVLDQHAT
jgi:PAS domain S-box-containing protein